MVFISDALSKLIVNLLSKLIENLNYTHKYFLKNGIVSKHIIIDAKIVFSLF